MNEKNLEYLLNQVKFTGFGEGLESEIRDRMLQQPDEFVAIHRTKFNNDDVVSTLNFKKSEKSELYFFNSYDVALKIGDSPDISAQRFRINNKGQSISLKEAYNLMNGRAVHKELTNKKSQTYRPWVMLDYKNTDEDGNYKLKMFFEKYGYNLDKALARYPIKELKEEPGKTNLMQSLEKGNLQTAVFEIDGKEHKFSIEANPNTRGINIYDANMQRVDYKQLLSENKSQSESKGLQKREGQSETVNHETKQGNDRSEKQTRRQARAVA